MVVETTVAETAREVVLEDGRAVVVRLTTMRSGRRWISAWEPLPIDEPLPRGAEVMRDAAGWWKSLPDDEARAAFADSFPDLPVKSLSDRWPGYWVGD